MGTQLPFWGQGHRIPLTRNNIVPPPESLWYRLIWLYPGFHDSFRVIPIQDKVHESWKSNLLELPVEPCELSYALHVGDFEGSSPELPCFWSYDFDDTKRATPRGLETWSLQPSRCLNFITITQQLLFSPGCSSWELRIQTNWL